MGQDQVDPREALQRIHVRFGVERVVLNAGGTFNAAFLRAGLVDVIDVVTVPGLVGGAGTPSFFDGPANEVLSAPIQLDLIDVRVDGNFVRTRYRVVQSRFTAEPSG